MLFVDVTGLENAIGKLQLLQAKGEDLTPLLKYIGEDEVTRTLLRFETATAPDGSRWKGLEKPRPPRKKQRPYGDNLVLSDTGKLRGSIRYVLGNNSVTVGMEVEYSIFHQFGTKHIPARPFLGVSDELINEMEVMIGDYFQL